MSHYIKPDIQSYTVDALQKKFCLQRDAATLGYLTPDGQQLVERARAAGGTWDVTPQYVFVQQGWWALQGPGNARTHRVPFPGADLRLAGLYGELTTFDALIDGPHGDHTYARIAEDIAEVEPLTTQRVMFLHQDKDIAARGAKHNKPVGYFAQDEFIDQTAVWLSNYRGSKDSAARHLLRLRRDLAAKMAVRNTELSALTYTGDAAYQRWLAKPETQARLWVAPAFSVVRARVGVPHMGRPNTGPKTVRRVFSRLVFYRPGMY